ncbi:ADP-ribosylation factor-like protein 2 [Sporobolomyces koalae]|uniref:ADP-ribosylation factor-like protein 2 n=1 Tax=Sporobolomyces koalae TaxID=500713 RepID=UPI00318215E8
MGLLTIIRKTRLKEKQIRVLMLGLDNAGKTTICKALLGEDVDQVSPTLGFNIRTIMHAGYTLNVWDIGGQTSLRPYWKNYFEQTDAIVWVVDSSDRQRIRDCRVELHQLLQEERLLGASLLVFANKQDIPGSLTPAEISDALDLASLSNSHRWSIQPCSARFLSPSLSTTSSPPCPPPEPTPKRTSLTDPRISKGLDWVVQEVASRVYYNTQPTLNLNPAHAPRDKLEEPTANIA